MKKLKSFPTDLKECEFRKQLEAKLSRYGIKQVSDWENIETYTKNDRLFIRLNYGDAKFEIEDSKANLKVDGYLIFSNDYLDSLINTIKPFICFSNDNK